MINANFSGIRIVRAIQEVDERIAESELGVDDHGRQVVILRQHLQRARHSRKHRERNP